MTHTYGSLFSGVGGFDMGFDQAGWDCKFQVEWDKHCTNILTKHWPDVPKWSDVSTVSGADLPPVDCIIWGSPCQDMSVAGKRAGLDGERSGLFYQGIRIIKEMRDATNGMFPRWSVWENVAGALSSNRGADFGNILDKMAESGALDIQWNLLDAQYYGIPQRRRRVFVVACYDSATFARCPDPLLPVSESVPGDFAAGKQKRKGAAAEIAACLRSGSGLDGVEPVFFQMHQSGETRIQEGVMHTLAGYMGTGGNNTPMVAFTKSRRAQTVDDCETWVEGAVNPTLNSFDVGDTRTTTAIIGFSHTQGLDAQPSEVHWPTLRMNGSGHAVAIGLQGNMIGRADHNGPQGKGHTDDGDPMSTLTGTDIHAVAYDGYNQKLDDTGIHRSLRIGRDSSDFVARMDEPNMVVRRLTPVECERLMGWPDDHTRYNADGTVQSDTHRYKQAGNGVATPVAKWIAQHLKQVDG